MPSNLDRKKKKTLFSLDDDIIQRLDAFRKIKKITRSRLVEFICSEFFKNKTKDEK